MRTWRNWNLYVDGGSAKWLGCCGTQFRDPQSQHRAAVWPAIPVPGAHPEGPQAGSHTSRYTHVHSNTRHKRCTRPNGHHDEWIHTTRARSGIMFTHTNWKTGWEKYRIHRSSKNDTTCGPKCNRNIQPGQKEGRVVRGSHRRLMRRRKAAETEPISKPTHTFNRTLLFQLAKLTFKFHWKNLWGTNIIF